MRRKISMILTCCLLVADMAVVNMAANVSASEITEDSVIVEDVSYEDIVIEGEDIWSEPDDVLLDEIDDPYDTDTEEDEAEEEQQVDDSYVEDIAEDVISEDVLGEEQEIYEESVTIDEVDETEEIVEEAIDNTDSDGISTIVAFDSYDSEANALEIDGYNKPRLSELYADMPNTLGVTLINGKDEIHTSIRVKWYCVTDDYDEPDRNYYQFSPRWDNGKYRIADGMDVTKDAPYIPVYVNWDNKGRTNANNTIKSVAYSASNEEVKEEVYKFLTEKIGMNNAAACGVMANIQCESSFRPTAVGDGGTSFGLCQWHASRYSMLKNYCYAYGYDYTSVEGQMNYLKYELENSYRTVLSTMKSVPNTSDGAYYAGYYWCVKFEIPANKETVGVTRGNLASNAYWPIYGYRSNATYTITYVLNGGKNSSSNPKTYKSSSSAIKLYAATRKGYTFKGWYTEPTFKYKYSSIPAGTAKNITLYAKWTANRYHIKYYGNGATSGSMLVSTKRAYGKKYKLRTNKYKRTGYEFIGWNTKKNGTGKSYANKATIKNLSSKNGGTVKLYAQWKKKDVVVGTYTIKFDGNGATGGTMQNMTGVRIGREVTLNENMFTRRGYDFVGWNTKKDGSGLGFGDEETIDNLCSKPGSVVTLYALWEQ